MDYELFMEKLARVNAALAEVQAKLDAIKGANPDLCGFLRLMTEIDKLDRKFHRTAPHTPSLLDRLSSLSNQLQEVHSKLSLIGRTTKPDPE